MPETKPVSVPFKPLDLHLIAGIVIASAALGAGIALTGVRLAYFFQPAGILIVVGGTLGVAMITTPRGALLNSVRRMMETFHAPRRDREALVREILSLARTARTRGLLGIEAMIDRSSDAFLRESLMLALDANQRPELQATLETRIRLRERQGETDAKMLEVAGGFAPTIGVLGTVVGLIDVLRQFSDMTSVANGIGTAFVSTMYGLGLANLVLLPAAHRIRARVAEAFETQELITEGVLCIFDRIHPSIVGERLAAFLRGPGGG